MIYFTANDQFIKERARTRNAMQINPIKRNPPNQSSHSSQFLQKRFLFNIEILICFHIAALTSYNIINSIPSGICILIESYIASSLPPTFRRHSDDHDGHRPRRPSRKYERPAQVLYREERHRGRDGSSYLPGGGCHGGDTYCGVLSGPRAYSRLRSAGGRYWRRRQER